MFDFPIKLKLNSAYLHYIYPTIIIKIARFNNKNSFMNPPTIITILTIVTFLLGWFSHLYTSAFSYGLTFLLTGIISYFFPRINHLDFKELFKILATTYIFGLADGYYFFIKEEWDVFGIFVWLSTIRYYGEFQLINNFHHYEL